MREILKIENLWFSLLKKSIFPKRKFSIIFAMSKWKIRHGNNPTAFWMSWKIILNCFRLTYRHVEMLLRYTLLQHDRSGTDRLCTRIIEHRIDWTCHDSALARLCTYSYANTIGHRLDCARIGYAKTIRHQHQNDSISPLYYSLPTSSTKS